VVSGCKGSDRSVVARSSPGELRHAESIYLRGHLTDALQSTVHQGNPIPASAGGGVFDFAFAPVVNDQGDVLFTPCGNLSVKRLPQCSGW
jgi:hypothetical protein